MAKTTVTSYYRSPSKEGWQGRASDTKDAYWHETIQCEATPQEKDALPSDVVTAPTVALIGYACDEGVRRNAGRIGAKEGPHALRTQLAKLPVHVRGRLVDAGEVVCADTDLEGCQRRFAHCIAWWLARGAFPIGLGGGHDIAYAHYCGLRKALPDKRIGIVNFDAHFDLRPVVARGNSGTPFYQIAQEWAERHKTSYFALGIQQQANTKELFQIAKQTGAKYLTHFACHDAGADLKEVKEAMADFIARHDHLYITVDMDGFSSVYAPGVSAPSALGLCPFFVWDALRFLFDTKKVVACDIAELNPCYDIDRRTASLAARLVDAMATLYNDTLS